ncbi:hypothetical protein, partial [Bradyrhizobium sp.]|uniref:hypothetical protein n=1 Tax=Bradyrhizobium sp. TaxID=376 RepID=UPI003C4D26B9
MTDMRVGRLLPGASADNNVQTLGFRVAHLSPSSSGASAQRSSWKVIVSASRGQYLKPGSFEPGFFSSMPSPWNDTIVLAHGRSITLLSR